MKREEITLLGSLKKMTKHTLPGPGPDCIAHRAPC